MGDRSARHGVGGCGAKLNPGNPSSIDIIEFVLDEDMNGFATKLGTLQEFAEPANLV
jgi:hypothetical protein